jgi:hypothetical protein
MDGAFEPISLGYSCEVKYQLSRALYMRKHPDGSEDELRNLLQTTERGQRSFERHIFDWQITPFAAVLEYLDRDFQGVFEREDLTVEDGEVVHRRLGTRHPHDFHAADGVLDEAAIDAGYADARGKFEHLAAKFRRHLRQPGPFLYVCKEIRIYDEVVRLAALLRQADPDHAFQILFVGYDGEDQTLSALEGEVFKAWTPMAPDKEPGHEWEGHNQAWEEALAPWALTVHGGDRITRTYEESLTPPPLQRTGRRGWLGRLLGGR